MRETGGVCALQAIVIEMNVSKYRRSADFIQKHIFPGGALLSPNVLRDRAAAAGLQWTSAAGTASIMRIPWRTGV